MKEIQKNSLFNYFSKKKPSEGEPNTENRQGEISNLKNRQIFIEQLGQSLILTLCGQ